MHRICLRSRARHLALAALLISSAPNARATESPSSAQEKQPDPAAPVVEVGSRVRFTEAERHGLFRQKRWIEGTVIEMDEASVTVRSKKDAPVRIVRTSPGTFQVSRGQRSRILRGALGGLGAGLLVTGGAWLVNEYGGGYCSCTEPPEPMDLGKVAGTATLAGVALGSLAALAHPMDDWAHASLSPIPASSGGTVAWRISPITDFRRKSAGLRLQLAW